MKKFTSIMKNILDIKARIVNFSRLTGDPELIFLGAQQNRALLFFRSSRNKHEEMCPSTGCRKTFLQTSFSDKTESQPQEVGSTFIGENGLVVMAGAESVERFQIHQTHGFQVF
jgi:hypothetical protein